MHRARLFLVLKGPRHHFGARLILGFTRVILYDFSADFGPRTDFARFYIAAPLRGLLSWSLTSFALLSFGFISRPKAE